MQLDSAHCPDVCLLARDGYVWQPNWVSGPNLTQCLQYKKADPVVLAHSGSFFV